MITPIALVGTKSDQERKVPTSAGYNFMQQLNLDSTRNNNDQVQRCQIVGETSAFDDVQSVTSLFADMAQEIAQNHYFDDAGDEEKEEVNQSLLGKANTSRS